MWFVGLCQLISPRTVCGAHTIPEPHRLLAVCCRVAILTFKKKSTSVWASGHCRESPRKSTIKRSVWYCNKVNVDVMLFVHGVILTANERGRQREGANASYHVLLRPYSATAFLAGAMEMKSTTVTRRRSCTTCTQARVPSHIHRAPPHKAPDPPLRRLRHSHPGPIAVQRRRGPHTPWEPSTTGPSPRGSRCKAPSPGCLRPLLSRPPPPWSAPRGQPRPRASPCSLGALMNEPRHGQRCAACPRGPGRPSHSHLPVPDMPLASGGEIQNWPVYQRPLSNTRTPAPPELSRNVLRPACGSVGPCSIRSCLSWQTLVASLPGACCRPVSLRTRRTRGRGSGVVRGDGHGFPRMGGRPFAAPPDGPDSNSPTVPVAVLVKGALEWHSRADSKIHRETEDRQGGHMQKSAGKAERQQRQ